MPLVHPGAGRAWCFRSGEKPAQDAGLQAVPTELHEAAALDGASPLQRFFSVTLPTIRTIILIATLFSIIFTFSDFQLIYVLTKGGPASSTHIFGTYAYQMMGFSALGQAAAKVGGGGTDRFRGDVLLLLM